MVQLSEPEEQHFSGVSVTSPKPPPVSVLSQHFPALHFQILRAALQVHFQFTVPAAHFPRLVRVKSMIEADKQPAMVLGALMLENLENQLVDLNFVVIDYRNMAAHG